MRFFIDTANIDEIKEANDLGVVCGVTTKRNYYDCRWTNKCRSIEHGPQADD